MSVSVVRGTWSVYNRVKLFCGTSLAIPTLLLVHYTSLASLLLTTSPPLTPDRPLHRAPSHHTHTHTHILPSILLTWQIAVWLLESTLAATSCLTTMASMVSASTVMHGCPARFDSYV